MMEKICMDKIEGESKNRRMRWVVGVREKNIILGNQGAQNQNF